MYGTLGVSHFLLTTPAPGSLALEHKVREAACTGRHIPKNSGTPMGPQWDLNGTPNGTPMGPYEKWDG